MPLRSYTRQGGGRGDMQPPAIFYPPPPPPPPPAIFYPLRPPVETSNLLTVMGDVSMARILYIHPPTPCFITSEWALPHQSPLSIPKLTIYLSNEPHQQQGIPDCSGSKVSGSFLAKLYGKEQIQG